MRGKPARYMPFFAFPTTFSSRCQHSRVHHRTVRKPQSRSTTACSHWVGPANARAHTRQFNQRVRDAQRSFTAGSWRHSAGCVRAHAQGRTSKRARLGWHQPPLHAEGTKGGSAHVETVKGFAYHKQKREHCYQACDGSLVFRQKRCAGPAAAQKTTLSTRQTQHDTRASSQSTFQDGQNTHPRAHIHTHLHTSPHAPQNVQAAL